MLSFFGHKDVGAHFSITMMLARAQIIDFFLLCDAGAGGGWWEEYPRNAKTHQGGEEGLSLTSFTKRGIGLT